MSFQNIVVLTGAGISAESGVPVFRGADGLWHGRRIEDVATHAALKNDLWGVNAFFNELRRFVAPIMPNPAHLALKHLEEAYGSHLLLVTQNIDPLHNLAGNKNLLQMHGKLQSALCLNCETAFPFHDDITKDTLCPACQRLACLRPDIVLFHEIPYHMDNITDRLMQCDLFIAIGTSGFVYPAAGFVDIARHVGAHTIEINLAETERSLAFHEKRTGPAGQTLPTLVDELIEKKV